MHLRRSFTGALAFIACAGLSACGGADRPTQPAAVDARPRKIQAHILEASTLPTHPSGDAEVISESQALRMIGEGKVLSAPTVIVNADQEATITLGDDARLMTLRVKWELPAPTPVPTRTPPGDDTYAVGYTESSGDKTAYEIRGIRLRCKFGEAIVLRGLVAPGTPRVVVIRPEVIRPEPTATR